MYSTDQLSPFSAGLGATVILAFHVWSARVWIPSVVTLYGRAHDEWQHEWRPRASTTALVVATQVGLMLAMMFGAKVEAAPFAALMAAALSGVVQADWRFKLIPDRFQVLGAVGALGYVLFARDLAALDMEFWISHLLAGPGIALALGTVASLYERLRGKDGLGFGDVKLIAWLGLAVGSGILTVLTAATLIALVAVLPTVVMRRRTVHATFAFGPFIVLGLGVHSLWAVLVS